MKGKAILNQLYYVKKVERRSNHHSMSRGFWIAVCGATAWFKNDSFAFDVSSDWSQEVTMFFLSSFQDMV